MTDSPYQVPPIDLTPEQVGLVLMIGTPGDMLKILGFMSKADSGGIEIGYLINEYSDSFDDANRTMDALQWLVSVGLIVQQDGRVTLSSGTAQMLDWWLERDMWPKRMMFTRSPESELGLTSDDDGIDLDDI